VNEAIIVVGHRSPDNDSICSAVGYARLKNLLDPAQSYEAMRLGPLPPESAYVLSRFGLPEPAPLKHVHSRVRDVMTSDPLQVNVGAPMRAAAEIFRQNKIRTLVACDGAGLYQGIIDTQTFANLYLAELDEVEPNASNPNASDPNIGTRFATLARPINDFLTTHVPLLDPEDLLSEARERVLASELRQGVVLNASGEAIGIVTRTDLARHPRRKIILVDHNEVSQAVAGIAEAEVIEVVDHHRIGDIQTARPIQFINLPLGSSASIVTSEYLHHGLQPEPAIAAALLSAVLTDTVLLKSPTTTARDRELAALLAQIAALDLDSFGREILEARFAGQDGSVESVIRTDCKEYSTGDSSFTISQYETINTARILARQPEILAYLQDMVDKGKLEFALLLITDITREGSQFLAAGKAQIVEKVFGVSLTDGSAWVPGVLSRKKQVAPRLLD
jgi:manganese-dependent inorganic pyrophosphatase